jgi:hypothetical protein
MPGVMKETTLFAKPLKISVAATLASTPVATAVVKPATAVLVNGAASMAVTPALGLVLNKKLASAVTAAGATTIVAHPALTNVAATKFVAKPWFRDWAIVLELPAPRDQIGAPISPSGAIIPDTLYEDPLDASKKFALPMFNLAEQTVDGQTRLRVSFERVQPVDPANQKWLLCVRFNVAPRRPDAQDLTYTSTVLLRFTPPIAGAMAKELPFAVEQEDATTWKASMLMIGLTERDQVVNALKSSDYQTRFLVRCSFLAAVPDAVNAQRVQLYRRVSHSVDVPLNRDPFFIDPAQHAYLYSEVQDATTHVFGLKLHQVEFQGRIQHYYQDEASPYIFYYLPDSYKVTRRPDAPFTPQMLVKFRSEDGSLEKMRASLEYVAAPVVNSARLADARQALKPHLPTPMPPDITDAIFLPLGVDDINQLTLNLALPRQGVAGSPRQPRPGVVTKLSDDFQDEIADLSLQNFQDVFDALFGKSAVVFMGDVQVAASGDRPAETVPFAARLADLSGRLLEEFEVLQPDGSIDVRLRNGIESPLTLRSMPVQILLDAQFFPAHVQNLTKGGAAIQFPVPLAPGEELTLKVVPDQALPTGGTPDAVFGLDDVVVAPDSSAVWNAILDTSLPAEYQRVISVMSFAEWFAPDTELMAIGIYFKNGDHVVLKRDALEAKATVRVPVSDLVLRNVQDSAYAYTMLLVYKTRQVRLEKTDTLDILFPEVPS